MSYSQRKPGELTPRMLEVMDMACDGATARETARALHIAEATVKVIRAGAVDRLGVRNLQAATAEYRRRGLSIDSDGGV